MLCHFLNLISLQRNNLSHFKMVTGHATPRKVKAGTGKKKKTLLRVILKGVMGIVNFQVMALFFTHSFCVMDKLAFPSDRWSYVNFIKSHSCNHGNDNVIYYKFIPGWWTTVSAYLYSTCLAVHGITEITTNYSNYQRQLHLHVLHFN